MVIMIRGFVIVFYNLSEIRIAEDFPLWLTESCDLDIGPWECDSI